MEGRLPVDLEHSASPLPVSHPFEETAGNRRRAAGNPTPYLIRNIGWRNEFGRKLDRCQDDPTVRQTQRQQVAVVGKSRRCDRDIFRRSVQRELLSVG